MDIAEFVFKKNEKILREFVTKTWQMKSTKKNLAASKASQIDTFKTSDFVEGNSAQRLQFAKKVELNPSSFYPVLKIY